MTTRRWMIVVAIAGVSLGAGVALNRMRRLQTEYRSRAAVFSSWETSERKLYQRAIQLEKRERQAIEEHLRLWDEYNRLAAEVPRYRVLFTLLKPQDRGEKGDEYKRLAKEARWQAARSKIIANQYGEDAVRAARRTAAFAGLRSKYERAARRPWLAVEPDPPEPN